MLTSCLKVMTLGKAAVALCREKGRVTDVSLTSLLSTLSLRTASNKKMAAKKLAGIAKEYISHKKAVRRASPAAMRLGAAICL